MEPARLTLHDPADVISAVPYLLGFPPTESLVVFVLDGSHLLVTARYDAEHVMDDLSGPRVFAPLLASVGVPGARIVLVAYREDRRAAALLLSRATRALTVPVLLSMVVSGGRWWMADDPQTCPGTPVDQASAVVAHAVVHGLTVAASRDEIALALAGPPRDTITGLRRQLQTARRVSSHWTLPAQQRAMADRISRSAVEPLDTQVLLECVALLESPRVRDVVWAHLCPQTARVHVNLWSQVIHVTPPGEQLLAVCALGFAAWQAGQGALMTLCTQQAAALDPTHHLVDMLEAIAAGCVPPSLWELCREAAGVA